MIGRSSLEDSINLPGSLSIDLPGIAAIQVIKTMVCFDDSVTAFH